MYHSLVVGKSVSKVSKILKRSGSTWPGHLILKFDPKFIRKALNKNPGVKVVFIAGTNGKTTTTKALSLILESNNFSVLTNQTGANLLNGLASLIINKADLKGNLKHKSLIFEVDENSLPIVLREIPNPDAVILLNLFRDQLDRYGEVNTISTIWIESLKKLDDKTLIVANADDPLIAYIADSCKNSAYFTIDNIFKKEVTLSHAVDSTTCPRCNYELIYSGISYSHLGNYNCPDCHFQNPKAKRYDLKTDLKGDFNRYNLSSAVLVADKVFGINPYTSLKSLEKFKPAFGRQEIFDVNERKVMLLLSKNPTGFNESLKVVINDKSDALLLLLNDRIPDGRDISWIWDVDFEMLKGNVKKIIVSGDRAYDLGNRLLFAGIENEVYEDFVTAYKKAIELTAKGKTLSILPTYSAMLEVRKLISGKSLI